MINRMTKPNCISYSLVLLFGLRIIDIVEQYAHLGTRAKQNLAKALFNIEQKNIPTYSKADTG